MEGESRELGDAGVVGRRVGADGAKRQGLAPGAGAGGDAVVDGGAEELLEIVGGLDVEGGGLVIAGQQSLPFEGAGCAGGDGVEQALEFGLDRCCDYKDPFQEFKEYIKRLGTVKPTDTHLVATWCDDHFKTWYHGPSLEGTLTPEHAAEKIPYVRFRHSASIEPLLSRGRNQARWSPEPSLLSTTDTIMGWT